MSQFRERTASGILWSVLGQFGRQSGVLLTTVVLSRLLPPRDFGLVAIILIFSNFAFVVSEQGFGAALIQRKNIGEEHRSSIWWLNVAAGALMSALFFAAAPWIARVYGEPALGPLSRGLSCVFFIHGLGMVHNSLLARELDFKRLARVETVAAWTAFAAAVLLAWRGAGAWSVIGQAVATVAVSSAGVWLLCPWRPRALFKPAAVAELAPFSTNHFLTNAAGYWVRNVDNLLIGLTMGAHPLGVYTRAYAVMLFPLNRVSRVLSRVMLPSFSLIQEEPARVASLFLRMTRAVALVTFPMMLGLIACAGDFVPAVFGPGWEEMVPVLRVLSVVGLVQSLTVLTGNLFASQDRTGLRLFVQLPLSALQVLGIALGLRWGILGVAVGYAAACLMTAPVLLHFAGAVVGLTLARFTRAHAGILACAAAAAAAGAALAALLPVDWPAPARLLLETAAGAGVYWAALNAFRIEGLQDLLKQLRKKLPAAEGAA